MAETQTPVAPVQQLPQRGYTIDQLEALWARGKPVYYSIGDPVPEGAQVTPHEGGIPTLERVAPPHFDMDIREKFLRQIDLAFERCFKEPSEEFPQGRRPYLLLVNPGFTHYFPNLDAWGELNPPCRVREVDGKDKRFLSPNAVRVGPEGRQIKSLFVTDEPDKASLDSGNW